MVPWVKPYEARLSVMLLNTKQLEHNCIILLLIKLTSLHKSLLDFFYYVSDRMNNFTTNVKLRMSEC